MGITVDKCLQAWTNSIRQLKARADIVFFGDSLTYYGDFSSVFPNKVVCNLGLRGDTILGLTKRVSQVQLLKPKYVLLQGGINDIVINSKDTFFSEYESLVQELLAVLPSSELILQNLLPVNNLDFSISCNNSEIILFNESISNIALQYHLRYIDLFHEYEKDGMLPREITSDGIHLLAYAYSKWYHLVSLSI